MKADIGFEFAKVYDISKVDVVLGQNFTLDTDLNEETRWFSDNDPVLSLEVQGNRADGKALAPGTSTILIMNTSFGLVKELTIRVVDQIMPMAASLGASAGDPEPK